MMNEELFKQVKAHFLHTWLQVLKKKREKDIRQWFEDNGRMVGSFCFIFKDECAEPEMVCHRCPLVVDKKLSSCIHNITDIISKKKFTVKAFREQVQIFVGRIKICEYKDEYYKY